MQRPVRIITAPDPQHVGLEFDSVKEAAEFIGCDSSSIAPTTRGKRKIYGYQFEYLEAPHPGGGSPTHISWASMKQRCNDRNAQYYGARGITYCDRWELYTNFLEDMGERPEGMTLDRKNPDGHYTPDNCRWATPKQQVFNRRPFKTSHSGKEGVRNTEDKTWAARISADGKGRFGKTRKSTRVYLGPTRDQVEVIQIEAKRIRDLAGIKGLMSFKDWLRSQIRRGRPRGIKGNPPSPISVRRSDGVEFPSMKEAARQTPGAGPAHIRAVILGIRQVGSPGKEFDLPGALGFTLGASFTP